MERIKALINKLYEQSLQDADMSALIQTVHQIQQELTNPPTSNLQRQQLGTAKVAVVMPAAHSRYVPAANGNGNGTAVPEIAPIPKELHENKPEPVVLKTKEGNNWNFDPMREIPTLTQQVNTKELNDIIGQNGTSLNDALKTQKTEIAESLTETPIRDLKKGIGINDRYVFVSELFRGDEAMYERSIKTINAFRILPEAEYWMDRELKVKLGWDDGKTITQHFYQLVRRRFS